MAGLRLTDWSLTPEERLRRNNKELDQMMSQMKPEALEIFRLTVIPKIIHSQIQFSAAADRLLEGVHYEDFLSRPVNIKTFVTDPYFLGSILHDGLYPKLLDDLIELFAGSYAEVLPTGSSLDCLVYEEDGGLPTLATPATDKGCLDRYLGR